MHELNNEHKWPKLYVELIHYNIFDKFNVNVILLFSFLFISTSLTKFL